MLLVPRRAVRSFQQIRPVDAVLFGHMIRLAFTIAARREMYSNGFAILINGGAYQDVAQAHLHLAGLDQGLRYIAPTMRTEPTLSEASGLIAFEHPGTRRQIHIAIVPSKPLAWRDLSGSAGVQLGEALVDVGQRLVARYGLASGGFTLLASIPPDGQEDAVCFHLVAGAHREPEGARPANPEHGPATLEPGRSPQRSD